MTLRIQTLPKEDVVAYALSGRIEGEEVAELQRLCEGRDRRVVLDLKEVKLVDRDTVRFLAQCEANGILLQNCPAYIREWIVREGT
jgi:anti-anti-sigma regulatory factor